MSGSLGLWESPTVGISGKAPVVVGETKGEDIRMRWSGSLRRPRFKSVLAGGCRVQLIGGDKVRCSGPAPYLPSMYSTYSLCRRVADRLCGVRAEAPVSPSGHFPIAGCLFCKKGIAWPFGSHLQKGTEADTKLGRAGCWGNGEIIPIERV